MNSAYNNSNLLFFRLHGKTPLKGGHPLKTLSLLMWVTQFGFSALFPLCAFLLGAAWLQNRFALGVWIFLPALALGLLTGLCSARGYLKSLRKAAEEAAGEKKSPPTSFNRH